MAELRKGGSGIPSVVPPCGKGIYIRWHHLIFIYVHSSAVYRRLDNLTYVGLSGCSSPQYHANSLDLSRFIQLLLNNATMQNG